MNSREHLTIICMQSEMAYSSSLAWKCVAKYTINHNEVTNSFQKYKLTMAFMFIEA
ncbi:rCG62635 [Rattus norvegicus]|uniref:RCG62635 n=1 Tax=Rattus norvegicus TaxID=10116 RepID=A6J5P9_RAT|nr:rCG62635 [Rattus norvegicus]